MNIHSLRISIEAMYFWSSPKTLLPIPIATEVAVTLYYRFPPFNSPFPRFIFCAMGASVVSITHPTFNIGCNSDEYDDLEKSHSVMGTSSLMIPLIASDGLNG